MPLLLGLDIGTSATKAVLIDPARHDGGRVVASATSEYAPYQPHPDWSEQNPEDWWTAVCNVCRQLALRVPGGSSLLGVTGIGLSGQMHGLVLLGPQSGGSRAAHPLRPAILWNDQRTAAECAEIEHAIGGKRRLIELTGNAALTGFTLPKLLWVRRHEPAILARAQSLLLPKDFICFRLTDQIATDAGDAAGTLLLDVARRNWSPDMCDAHGILPSLLPPVLESCSIAGHISPVAAGLTGLPTGIPVVAGSGDNMAGGIGTGVVEPGLVAATIGTSGVVFAHTASPRRDLAPGAPDDCIGRLHTMCAADGTARRPGGFTVTGCMLSAGGALRWARDVLCPGVSYDDMMAHAASAPIGCEGLTFLPYLTGERCPHPDPAARGAWIGLTSRHTRAHLIRAVVEGVTFGMAQMLDLMRDCGVEVSRIRLGGGGARSPLWRQMQADVYGSPCGAIDGNAEDICALGAAVMAGVGTGVWPSAQAACAEVVRVDETISHNPAATAAYQHPRALHAALYHDLKHRFAEMAG